MRLDDEIVARLAVERGWVSADTLRAFIDEVNEAAEQTSLAALLRRRGVLDETQHKTLASEEARRMRLVERFTEIRKADSALGEALRTRGLVDDADLAEGLHVQGAEREAGRVRRLGDILVERGRIGRGALADALRAMGQATLTCATCGASGPVDAGLACGACGGPLVDEATLSAIRRDRPAPPDEVRIAEQMPDREYGKFVLVQHLGSGGMGTVWKAWDRDLGRWVALKMLRGVQDPLRHDEDVRRFMREASVAARLHHPNIVAVYESGERKGQQVIVMQYVDGKPLAHLRLGPRRALEVVRDAARGVQYAHDQGVVHRDLKPGNVMLSADGQVVVMDFGLARSLGGGPSTLTQTGFVLGTPMYMPPEQAQAVKDRDEKRCDVYSLGATLYDLLTGRPPFEGEQWEVVGDVVFTEPVPPRRRNPELSREADVITLKAMSKQPSQRYASAGALADDIDRHLRGESIVARPAPVWERAGRWVRRHRAASIAAAVIVGTVAVSALVVRSTGPREAAKLVEAARKALGEHREAREKGGAAAVLQDRFAEGIRDCNAALALVPGHAEARSLLGDFFWERYLLAEQREEADLATPAAMVRAYAAERYGTQLDAQARVWLSSEPSGAEVEYVALGADAEGRMAGKGRKLGRTPLEGVEIRRGSGVFRLRLAGRAEARVPVMARRTEEMRIAVRLYAGTEVPEGFVHIPAGPFLFAGDEQAERPAARARPEVGDYFISRTEVTWGEYMEFVDSLDVEGMQRRVPKLVDGRTPRLRWGGTRYGLPSEYKDLPVTNVVVEDAVEYCRWRSARDGMACRLPTGVEWEKAARGVDGRAYPWGNGFAWLFTVGARTSSDDPGRPEPVGTTPGDESVYGVRDMGGNVGEMCSDPAEGPGSMYEFRGGQFLNDSPRAFRCASRHRGNVPQAVVGFRVAASAAR